MKTRYVAPALMIIATPVYAHGEEVLILPVGQIVGLLLMFSFTKWFVASTLRIARWVSLAFTAVLCSTLLFVPTSYFPDDIRYSLWGNYLLGVVPPLMFGVVTGYVMQHFRCKGHGVGPGQVLDMYK